MSIRISIASVLSSMAILAGCTVPTLEELRAMPAAQRFEVAAPLPCLYAKGAESASGYILGPRFTWYIAPDQQSAWFRQPEALVTLTAQADGETRIELMQSSGGRRFGQGEDLAQFLRSNPCAANR